MDCSMPASLSFTISLTLLRLKSIESVMPPLHLILCHPFLFPPSVFPSIRVFSNESVLHIIGQSIGISASESVLPMNIQDWFPLGLVWFPCSPMHCQESPTPQFESINSSVLSLLDGPTLTSTHDNWENHSFDFRDLCQQSDISASYAMCRVCEEFRGFRAPTTRLLVWSCNKTFSAPAFWFLWPHCVSGTPGWLLKTRNN